MTPLPSLCLVADGMNSYLAVSPLGTTFEDGSYTSRKLEVNWYGGEALPSDEIVVGVGGEPMERHSPADHEWNYLFSEISYPLEGGEGCEGHHASYLRGTGVLATGCVRARTEWMRESWDCIGDVPLRRVVLPGAHDAGAYDVYQGEASENLVTKYAVTQDESLGAQLFYGIRYLDIRVSYSASDEHVFWMVHGLVRMHPLIEGVRDVRAFLDATTHEIVIFDLHGFEAGFDREDRSDEAHRALIDFLIGEFGDHLAPRAMGEDVTAGQLVAAGRRLLLTYNDDRFLWDDLLWPGVDHQWGDVQSAEDLFEYLSGVHEDPTGHGGFWSGMAELTPTLEDILQDRFGGLRNMADMVNRNVTMWYRDLWAARTNIVAVDFFMGTDIVDVAVRANLLFQCGGSTGGLNNELTDELTIH